MATLDDAQEVEVYLSAKTVSDKVKEAMREVIRRNQAITRLGAKITEIETAIRVIAEEQGRMRMNMSQLDHDSDLYRRYVKKLGAQEDEVEKLRRESPS